MRALTHRAATATATALLLALTACGGGSEEPSAEPSSETPSGSSQESSPADQPAEGEEVEPSEFVADMKSGLEASTTAQVAMTIGAAGQTLDSEGEIDYTTDPPSTAMTMSNPMMGQQEIELRIVDGVMYMNVGRASQGKFVSFDLSETESLPPGLAGLEEQLDPLAAFRQMEPALQSVTFVGTEEVDGEELSHYELVLDSSKMKSLQQMPGAAALPEQIGYDLWFDDQFRARRMTLQLETAQPVDVEVELSEWGEPVDIEAPPANQVVDPAEARG